MQKGNDNERGHDKFTSASEEEDDGRSEESRLRVELMRNYEPDIRPVENTSSITYVNFTLINIHIIRLVCYALGTITIK